MATPSELEKGCPSWTANAAGLPLYVPICSSAQTVPKSTSTAEMSVGICIDENQLKIDRAR